MRILLAEDDQLLGDGLEAALSNEGYAVDWVQDGESADAALRTASYDAAVLDVQLPHLSGFDVLKALRGRRDMTPVLILTARDGVDDRVRGLDLGADDYLAKPFDMKELFARIRAIARRAKGRGSSEIVVGNMVMDPVAHTLTVDGAPVEMPHKEFLILRVLMENAGHYLTRAQIEDKLYKWDNPITSNAVEVHIHYLRKKLGTDRIRNVRGVGYVLDKS